MALDGAAKGNIFLTRNAGRTTEFAKTRETATTEGAAKNVASSGDTWVRREKPGRVTNPFLTNTSKPGLIAALKDYEIDTIKEEKEPRKEFSLDSYFDD